MSWLPIATLGILCEGSLCGFSPNSVSDISIDILTKHSFLASVEAEHDDRRTGLVSWVRSLTLKLAKHTVDLLQGGEVKVSRKHARELIEHCNRFLLIISGN